MQEQGIIEPVKYSEWASPAVPVLKRDHSVRVRGDYKITVNQSIKKEVYPLPTTDDLFTKLEGGVKFAKMDLCHAYQQIELDEDSQNLLVLNTHQGLMKYKRLNFGVATTPATFQRAIEGVLQGTRGTAVYLDDIIITGKSVKEYEENLMTTLTKLEEAGLTVKESKCEIDMDSVQYLGYKVLREGLTPLPDKLKSILEAPAPTNVAEVKSFLDMITYYVRFLPNISTIMERIHELTHTGVAWNWSKECKGAFEYSKNMLASARVLVHYDINKPLVLSVDASPYGIGAVLSHIIGDQEKPICFASRKLTTSERRYSQLDKEGLAVVYGVTKFQKYLEGRSFTIYTDHRPLLGLLGSDKPIPNLSSPRVQRWAILLA